MWFVAVFTGMLRAQPPWQWARQASLTGTSGGLLSACDFLGNVIVAGENQGVMVFDGDTLRDKVFLAAIDSLGSLRWMRSFPGLSDITSLDYRQRGILICGVTVADSAVVDTFKIPPKSGIVAKFNNSGNLLWLKIHHGATPVSIKQSYDDGVFVAGNYTQATIGQVRLESNGKDDIYVTHYSDDGRLKWVKSIGGRGNDQVADLAALVEGFWYGTVMLTGISRSDSLLIGENLILKSPPTFVAALNAAGDVNWAYGGYGAIQDNPLNVKFDRHGNFYITGRLMDTASFTFNGRSVKGNGKGDYYLLKIDTLGHVIWLKNSGSSNRVIIGKNMMDVSEYGNVYIGGFYAGSWKFGMTNLPTTSSHRLFIAKYSPRAVPVWAKAVGNDMDSATAGSISAQNSFGEVFLTGALKDTCDFSSSLLTLSTEHPQYFLAKLYDPAWSVNFLESGLYVKVFPNPAHDEVQVKLQSRNVSIKSLFLNDVQGRLILNGDPFTGRLNVSLLKKGVYMGCLITGQNQAVHFKVLVD